MILDELLSFPIASTTIRCSKLPSLANVLKFMVGGAEKPLANENSLLPPLIDDACRERKSMSFGDVRRRLLEMVSSVVFSVVLMNGVALNRAAAQLLFVSVVVAEIGRNRL